MRRIVSEMAALSQVNQNHAITVPLRAIQARNTFGKLRSFAIARNQWLRCDGLIVFVLSRMIHCTSILNAT